MATRMTVRQRIEAALRLEPVDQIPFTSYGSVFPSDDPDAAPLRELGLGVMSRVSLVTSSTPNVNVDFTRYEENGLQYARTTLKTPVGEAYSTVQLNAAYGSSWYRDHFVKRPEDYRVVEHWVRDTVYRENYEAYHRSREQVGEAGYVCGNFGYSPLMEMRVSLLGIERFSTDQFDHPELFHSLLTALTEKQREAYPLLADGPSQLVIYCGNCVPEVLGKGFARHCLTAYNEVGELLPARGKQL